MQSRPSPQHPMHACAGVQPSLTTVHHTSCDSRTAVGPRVIGSLAWPAAAVQQHEGGSILVLYSSHEASIPPHALSGACAQVNASPSLSTTTPADRHLKCKVVSDVLDIITPPEWQPGASSGISGGGTSSFSNSGKRGTDSVRELSSTSSFELIVDERGSKKQQRQPQQHSLRAAAVSGAGLPLGALGGAGRGGLGSPLAGIPPKQPSSNSCFPAVSPQQRSSRNRSGLCL